MTKNPKDRTQKRTTSGYFLKLGINYSGFHNFLKTTRLGAPTIPRVVALEAHGETATCSGTGAGIHGCSGTIK
jgi:hypothetical protein